jgi:hypothetical protein
MTKEKWSRPYGYIWYTPPPKKKGQNLVIVIMEANIYKVNIHTKLFDDAIDSIDKEL